MKISNWCKKLVATLVASGALAPAVSYAVDIPLGDASFEDFAVDPGAGFAYADTYRPTSAWVDDLDNPPDNIAGPPGNTIDDGFSQWLYDAAYAESTQFSKRPAPRTGDQAMHGLDGIQTAVIGQYSAQETSAVFEAGQTYSFSIWAQNDELLNENNGLELYIFDGTVPFSAASSIANSGVITAIPQRAPGMTAEQSQANWAQFSLSHTVLPGAVEIGHAVGVAFRAGKDTAVDDAALSFVPEPASMVLVGIGGIAALGLRRRG